MANTENNTHDRKTFKHEKTSVIFGSIGAGIIIALLILGLAFFGNDNKKTASNSDDTRPASSAVQSSGSGR